MKLNLIFPILLLLSSIPSIAQDFTLLEEIDFLSGGEAIVNAYAGNIVSGQFSRIDLDNDGKKDLFVFDRKSNIITPFLNKGGKGEINYQYAPSFRKVFPTLYSWVLLRDFNQDGIEDIFTAPTDLGIAGIRVYRGSRVNGELSFDLMTFPNEDDDILYYDSFNGTVQVYVSNLDLPDIQDIDGDGDLDVLSFEPFGSILSYYENTSVDKGFGLDTLSFDLKDLCFGKFVESPFNQELTLSPDPQVCAEGLMEETEVQIRHSGSTTTSLDFNNDGLTDILLGDLAYDGLILLENGGNENNAWMITQDINFPSNDIPVDIQIFNAAYYLDVNNDEKRDMIVTPNIGNGIQNFEHVWLYLNVGTDSLPIFELFDNDFLNESTLQLGLTTVPRFTDYNQDGLMDIIVGSAGFSTPGGERVASGLYLFENVGTAESPKYDLIDRDYEGMSAFSNTSTEFAPTIGDLDGDGDQDMIIGDNHGFLYFLENNAGDGNVFSFELPEYQFQGIRVGNRARPFIFDYNEDGLGDLIIGEQNFNNVDGQIGSLNYIENEGSVSSPFFGDINTSPNTQLFGNISLLMPGVTRNSSSPTLYDSGNDFLLLTGSETGAIYVFNELKGGSETDFNQIAMDLGNIYEGERSNIDLWDIDNDEFLELVLGNERGGITIYNTKIKTNGIISSSEVVEAEVFTIYPNPVINELNIILGESSFLRHHLKIYDAIGNEVLSKACTSNEMKIDVSDLSPGLYFLWMEQRNSRIVRQFVKL